MKIFKLSIFCITISLFLTSINIDSITIGELWKNVHVNSLIGLQKSIENFSLLESINYELWYDIILPLLKLEILLIFSLVSFLLFIYIIKK